MELAVPTASYSQLTASMKRSAPQVPFTGPGPDDLVSLEYSRSEAHRLDPSASRSREHGLGGHAVTRDHRLRTRGSGTVVSHLDQQLLNSVPSRQSAKRIPASFRASATVATPFPRRFSTSAAQSCSFLAAGARQHVFRIQAAWISTHLTEADPALVMPRRSWRSELDFSPGDSPR